MIFDDAYDSEHAEDWDWISGAYQTHRCNQCTAQLVAEVGSGWVATQLDKPELERIRTTGVSTVA
jgi:hypothetical protein